MSALDHLLDELADRLATRIVERLRAGEPDWIDQAASPLGRRHCAAARRRIASGLPGAAIIGRRHLLSPEALSEELGRASRGRAPAASSPCASIRDELAAELRTLKGGRR